MTAATTAPATTAVPDCWSSNRQAAISDSHLRQQKSEAVVLMFRAAASPSVQRRLPTRSRYSCVSDSGLAHIDSRTNARCSEPPNCHDNDDGPAITAIGFTRYACAAAKRYRFPDAACRAAFSQLKRKFGRRPRHSTRAVLSMRNKFMPPSQMSSHGGSCRNDSRFHAPKIEHRWSAATAAACNSGSGIGARHALHIAARANGRRADARSAEFRIDATIV